MHSIRRSGRCLILSVVAACPAVASAQIATPPVPVTPTITPVGGPTITQTTPVTPAISTIGSHQIDRFEAIRQLQADVASDANNVANWTILGELAHEVALDLPQGQDDAYYTLSRQAYERGAQLEPTNTGLQSALQFAREQEANAASFDARRRQGVATYLEARRREMAANGINPTVLVYETAAPISPTTNPNPSVVNQPYATTYPTATYRPYYNQQAQQPLGYNQYSTGYTPPVSTGTQTFAPTTLRQFGQQLPGVLINQGRVINR